MPDSYRIRKPWLWWTLSLASALCMFVFVTKIWSAGQSSGFSDLFAPWWGSREFLLHHVNPYSPIVAHQIQATIYGAPLTTPSGDILLQKSGGFAYPIYVAFLLSPTIPLSFTVVKTIFSWLLPVFALASFLLWLWALRWKPNRNDLIICALLYMGSFPVLQGLSLQNLSVLVGLFVAAAITCLGFDRLTAAGVLLAFSTIKPHFVALLLAWLAIWVFHDWKTRRNLAYSFIATLAVLVLGGEYFLPGWISEFGKIVRAYQQYTYGHSLLDVWLSTIGGHLAGATLLVATVVFCARWRSFPASSAEFFLICSTLLATTVLVIPTLEPHAQILLAPGFIFLHRYRSSIRALGRISQLLSSAAWLLIAWPWVAATVLVVAFLSGRATLAAQLWLVPLYTSPIIPLGPLAILAFVQLRSFRTKYLVCEP